MAADILLYQAKIVPVGEDQAQHLELARDIAQRFNALYGETFNDARNAPARGRRAHHGTGRSHEKMSKSATGANHAIALLDPPEVIRKKIARATTDSKPAIDPENMGAGVMNLFHDCACLRSPVTRYPWRACATAISKNESPKRLLRGSSPFRQKYREITADPAYVDGILREGNERVMPIAKDTIRNTKRAMGLYVPE